MDLKPILPDSENVYVRLLVNDGNQFDLELRSDSQLLYDLMQVLLQRSDRQSSGKVFKLPIDRGKSSFFLSSESLVAIATDPPIEIPEKLAVTNQPFESAESPLSKIIESSFVQFDNFLAPKENQSLLDYVLTHESEYVSQVNERSLAESFAPWRTLLLDRAAAALPQVLNQLGIPEFPLPKIEAGEFPQLNHPYKVESDNNAPDTSLRVLNFVYYLSSQKIPQNHSYLRIYDSQLVGDRCRSAQTFKTIEPLNNRIVFFFSSYSHEVVAVTSEQLPWADFCFKFNGWLHRPE